MRNYELEYQKRDKEKAKAYHAEWRAKNKDRIREYALKNPEATRARQKEWATKNPERKAEHIRKWAEKNLEHYKARKQELARNRYHTRPEVRERRKAAVKRYEEKNPDQTRQRRRIYQLRRYSLTPEAWHEMFIKQGERCASCKIKKTAEGKNFHVDHCHKTKKIRGILCHHCNLLLGNAKDNIATLEAAIQYLKEVGA